MKAMAVDIESRFQTIEEFQDVMLKNQTIHFKTKKKKKRKVISTLILFLFFLIIVLVGGIYYYLPNSSVHSFIYSVIKKDPISLSIMVSDDSRIAKCWNDFEPKFERCFSNIDLKLETIPNEEYSEIIKNKIDTNSLPDVFCVPNDLKMYVANSNTTKYLVSVARELDSKQYIQIKTIVNNYKEYFALPTAFDVKILYCNQKLFDDINAEYPNEDWIFDDFIEKAKELTYSINNKDYYGLCIEDEYFDSFLYANNQDFISLEENYDITSLTSSNDFTSLFHFRNKVLDRDLIGIEEFIFER